jgi:hypothetical protein
MALLEAAVVIKGISFLLGGTSVATLMKYLELREVNRRKSEVENLKLAMLPFELARILQRKNRVNLALMRIIAETKASRAAIARFENGGKLALVGSPLYISIIAEAFGKEEEELASLWQKQRVDPTHEAILRSVLAKKQIEVFERDLAEGVIKNAYIIHGIHRALYFEIAQPYGLYFYLCITFKTEEKDSIEDTEVIRQCFMKIKNIFEEDYKDFMFDQQKTVNELSEV